MAEWPKWKSCLRIKGMMSLPLLAVLTVFQGQALQLDYPDEPDLREVVVSWNDRNIPFVRDNDRWITVIGIDLDTEVGEYRAETTFHFAGGSRETRAETIDVKGKTFPTTRLTVAPKYVELSPEDRARAAADSKEIRAVYAQLTPRKYWTGPFRSPIPGVTGGRNFGHRRIFNDQPRDPHSGADLRASAGTEILAANTGRVVLAKDYFFNGNSVFIDHGLGVYTMYLHLSKISVEVGDVVKRGQVIGLAGATGRVTGPHLHWGARILDARVDPFSLFELD
jgi:murein DD-endopeptidase MepM/ murein hydrolase activator NlpD